MSEFLGADPGQLRELASTFRQSSDKLETAQTLVSNVLSRARWHGGDAQQFKSRWNSTLRPLLSGTAHHLTTVAERLVKQADEQEQASAVGTGSGIGPGGPGSGGSDGSPGSESWSPSKLLSDVTAVNNWLPYQIANATASTAGVLGNHYLTALWKAGLLTESFGQAPGVGYIRGTQLLNGMRMVGNAAGVLSIIGGVAQFADGYLRGDGYAMADGGITTILAAGSFVPVVGPAFAVAGLVWAGAGFLARGLGYSSTSEMVVDGAKWVGDRVSDGVNAVADGAKKVWGWLTG